MTIHQVRTRSSSLREAINSKAFMDGVRSIRKGKPFDYDYSTVVNNQWNYERGRQFAMIYSGDVKDGRHVTYHAMAAVSQALKDKVIF